jgi:hypothetical protein
MPNFHASATSVALSGPVLKARLFDIHGKPHEAQIDLNNIPRNDDGRFVWGGVRLFSLPTCDYQVFS